MPGKIKSGLGTLIGNAGGYFVVAELLKRGKIAALAPRNAPNFDILVTDGVATKKIRVKTKSEEIDDWQWSVKKDGLIFHQITNEDDFSILVNLAVDHRNMFYYIIPTCELNLLLIQDYEKWVSTPGKKGQPHNPANVKRNLSYTRYKDRLKPYLDNWEKLWMKRD